MERAKYQQGEWTILTITDNGKTIPARYKTKDWLTGWNDKYGCDVLTFEERLYQGLTNVMYPPEKESESDLMLNQEELKTFVNNLKE